MQIFPLKYKKIFYTLKKVIVFVYPLGAKKENIHIDNFLFPPKNLTIAGS